MDQAQDLMQTLRNHQPALRGLLASRDGQALLRQLTQQDGGASLQRAAQSAAKGDAAELTAMINRLMSSPEGAELVRRLNDSMQK